MADQIRWLDGQAKVSGNVEKICPKRHIRQNQWKREWNELYLTDRSTNCYDYISDYECIFRHPVKTSDYFNGELWDDLQAAKQKGTSISITNLAHFTNKPLAKEIIKSGGFTGGMKKIHDDANGHGDLEAKFSWWSPIFGEDDIKLVRDTLAIAIQPFLAGLGDQCDNEEDEAVSDHEDEMDSDQDIEEGSDEIDEEGGDQNDDEEGSEQSDDQDDYRDYLITQIQKQFATSNAFKPNEELYGGWYFQYDITELCEYYRIHFDCELQFKILGTFSYKKEVMHAVLICSEENGNGLFHEYKPVLTPEEDKNKDAVVTRDNYGGWEWKPEATGTEIKRLPGECIPYPKYRRWEHMAFAFHIPDEWGNNAFMTVPDLRRNLHNLPS
ncbi:uncharacterized protein [Montipora foliosa]|uniref:uncharacterized protein isoform X2 n=1 Tax=Montipora foliosa TaxID=591990 RepID=UPI0035F15140